MVSHWILNLNYQQITVLGHTEYSSHTMADCSTAQYITVLHNNALEPYITMHIKVLLLRYSTTLQCIVCHSTTAQCTVGYSPTSQCTVLYNTTYYNTQASSTIHTLQLPHQLHSGVHKQEELLVIPLIYNGP